MSEFKIPVSILSQWKLLECDIETLKCNTIHLLVPAPGLHLNIIYLCVYTHVCVCMYVPFYHVGSGNLTMAFRRDRTLVYPLSHFVLFNK